MFFNHFFNNLNILNDFLYLSKLEEGIIEFKGEWIELVPWFDEIIEELYYVLPVAFALSLVSAYKEWEKFNKVHHYIETGRIEETKSSLFRFLDKISLFVNSGLGGTGLISSGFVMLNMFKMFILNEEEFINEKIQISSEVISFVLFGALGFFLKEKSIISDRRLDSINEFLHTLLIHLASTSVNFVILLRYYNSNYENGLPDIRKNNAAKIAMFSLSTILTISLSLFRGHNEYCYENFFENFTDDPDSDGHYYRLDDLKEQLNSIEDSREIFSDSNSAQSHNKEDDCRNKDDCCLVGEGGGHETVLSKGL